jgi:hypothetical protein
MVPFNCAAGGVPDKVPAVFAKMAYGVGKFCWRGVNSVNAPLPLVRTAMSRQYSAAVEHSWPEIHDRGKQAPLLTAVARLVTGLATGLPFTLVS